MVLPSILSHHREWTFVGPMGPQVTKTLASFPILCVDGGAHFSERMDVWVGDSDSYGRIPDTALVFRHPIEKDHSDLALALKLLDELQRLKLHLWGFLGGRRDHELFNLGEALNFLEDHPESQILFYEGEKIRFHLVASGHWKFSHQGLFSMGSIKKTLVKLTGACHYPMTNFETLWPLSSFGLSNEGHGEMLLETDGPVFLYFPEEK